MDLTVIPDDNGNPSNDNVTTFNKNTNNEFSSNSDCDSILATTSNIINIEEIFPASNVIIKDLFELFKGNKSAIERDAAFLNYVKLLFNRFNV